MRSAGVPVTPRAHSGRWGTSVAELLGSHDMPYGHPQLRDDIRRHLVATGSKHWRQVRERHRGSEATFWRAVREVKAEAANSNIRAVVCAHTAVVRAAPLSPLPECLPPAAMGSEARPKHFGYMRAYMELFADVDALRACALTADGVIKKPAVFDRALRTRLKVLVAALRYERQVYDLRRVQSFVDALMEEIAIESPDLQRRLVARLRRQSDGIFGVKG